MASTEKLRPLRTPDLIAIFGCTHMTLLNWRNPPEGVEHRKTPLPFEQDGRAVLFNAKKVKTWAEKNGVDMKKDPLKMAAGKPIPWERPEAKKAPTKAAKKTRATAHKRRAGATKQAAT